jgi:hypothetical protein
MGKTLHMTGNIELDMYDGEPSEQEQQQGNKMKIETHGNVRDESNITPGMTEEFEIDGGQGQGQGRGGGGGGQGLGRGGGGRGRDAEAGGSEPQF